MLACLSTLNYCTDVHEYEHSDAVVRWCDANPSVLNRPWRSLVAQDETLRRARIELEEARRRLADLSSTLEKEKRSALTWSQRQARADAEALVRVRKPVLGCPVCGFGVKYCLSTRVT